uniref:Uncharacterized protein n=1 Tax=uncultured marine virus TaxID=186617 RepID=A0A0F7LAF0_9VIRU|nr:hypothetical protein [uncultured marine virus]
MRVDDLHGQASRSNENRSSLNDSRISSVFCVAPWSSRLIPTTCGNRAVPADGEFASSDRLRPSTLVIRSPRP